MKLRNIVLSTVLCILMLISSFNASAEFVVPEFANAIPNDVYQTPYMPDQFTTVYTPWLRNFNLMSKEEYAKGIHGGESCQQIRQLQFSPVNPKIVFFGTDTSGLYKSIDGGKSWFSCTNNANGWCTRGLLCDPLDENIVYVAYRSAGHFRSKDGGRTWEKLLADGDTLKIEPRTNMIAADAAGNIYLAAQSGLYRLDRKTDNLEQIFKGNGETWWDIAVSPDGTSIYGGCYETRKNEISSGIYTSHDAGKTWSIKGTDSTHVMQVLSIELHPENPNEIYVGANLKNKSSGTIDKRGLFVSTDAGETYTHRWSHVYENLAEGVAASDKDISGIIFGPKNSDGIYPLYYAANYATYPMRESFDYGHSFEAVIKAEHKVDKGTVREPENNGKLYTGYMFQPLAADPSCPGRVLCPFTGIVERLPDGTVNRINAGNSGLAVTNFVISSNGKIVLPAMDVRAYVPDSDVVYDGKGNYPTYRQIAIEQKDYYVNGVFDPKDGDHLIYFVGSSNGAPKVFGIRNSYDGGHTVTDIVEETKLEGDKRSNPMVMQYDAEDPNTIYCSQYKSTDNGKTWTPFIHEDKEMFVAAISPTNPNKFVAIYGPNTSKEIYVSEDKGETWKFLVNAGKVNDSNGYGILSMNFDVADENKLWFTWARRYWGYIDLKTGVIHKQQGMLGYNGNYQIRQNPKDANHLLMSSWPGVDDRTKDYKVAESRDGGKTWHPVPGFWGASFHCMKFMPDTDEVFIGTMAGVMIYDYAKFHEYLDSKITINLNDKAVSYSEMPVINNGRVLVPMRELFEQLGATVNYDDATRLITAGKEGTYVSLTPGSSTATINGEEVTLDAAPYITAKGRTMVPLRFVAEALNVGVGWDSRERTVYVK